MLGKRSQGRRTVLCGTVSGARKISNLVTSFPMTLAPAREAYAEKIDANVCLRFSVSSCWLQSLPAVMPEAATGGHYAA